MQERTEFSRKGAKAAEERASLRLCVRDAFPEVRPDDQIYTARAILVDADTLLSDAALLVRDGAIAWVGPTSDLPEHLGCARTDLGNVVLTPGLVNAHAHLEYSCCEGRIPRGPFHKWVRNMIAVRRTLTDDAIRAGAEEGLNRLIQSGTTTVADISSYGFSPDILETSGMRYRVFHEVISMDPPPYDNLISTVAEKLAAVPSGGLGTAGIAPHAPYSVAMPLMATLRERFHAQGVPFSVHVAECRSEITCLRFRQGWFAWAFRKTGFYPKEMPRSMLARSPREFVAGRDGETHSLEAPRDILVHGNYLSRRDMRRLAEGGRAALVVCPGTRAYHGVATPVLARARQAGLRVALGTDSLASNDTLDMWAEMRRLAAEAPDWVPADAWRAATETGAWALGLEDQIGRLQPGYQADFIAVSSPATLSAPDTPLPANAEALLTKWLRSDTSPEISSVWVRGRQVV